MTTSTYRSMHDARPGESMPARYTMKTTSRPSPSLGSSHPHTNPQAMRSSRPNKSTTTPAASPRAPYSVGQNHPPRPSPNRGGNEYNSSSPNYFGLAAEAPKDPREPSASSAFKGFATAAPQTQMPLDANPEFEAFKRAADLNRGKSFSLPTSHFIQNASTPGLVRPQPPRWNTHASETASGTPLGSSMNVPQDKIRSSSQADVEQDNSNTNGNANLANESSRNLTSPTIPSAFTGQSARYDSPKPMDPSQQRSTLTRAEDRDPRLSIMEHKANPPSPVVGNTSRASTMPANMDHTQPTMISGSQLQDVIKSYGHERLLLLDIRSSQNYAQSRIEGALNLCIPTTLLKRATYNIQKLKQTFQNGQDAEKFTQWRDMDCIIVYDSHASDHRDAVSAQNMVKKFTSEGYAGKTNILRGGFVMFQQAHSDLVDHRSGAELAGADQKDGGLAPVIGGVMLPTSGNGANPFFSNIRQNMDLADGVGQLEVSRPHSLESPLLAPWLREAASEADKGKKVSDKFLHIEKSEKARMQAAYAAFNPQNQFKQAVQLCGVEKGGKNRYKDILPFEHARVKLQDGSDHTCDYINASHLTAIGSNKRYIASQGPLPATFEDFWTAVWEQDVRVIVMLTAESEGGQLKCHSYWKGDEHGKIKLKALSEKKAPLNDDLFRADGDSSASTNNSETTRRRANTTTSADFFSAKQPAQSQAETPFVVIRKFALSHASHPFAPAREISHLHFSSWPDFGTPARPSHLLGLVELANSMQRSATVGESSTLGGNKSLPTILQEDPEPDPRSRPMLVHCSAGCGRTGTFCTVDTVIDMLKRQRLQAGQLAKSQDSEGDTVMDDGELSSPRKGRHIGLDSPSRRQSTSHKRTLSGSTLNNNVWVADDTTDLIEKTVEDFRKQRLSMVQSLRQFVLCYETILEWVHTTHEGGSSARGGRARSGSLQQSGR